MQPLQTNNYGYTAFTEHNTSGTCMIVFCAHNISNTDKNCYDSGVGIVCTGCNMGVVEPNSYICVNTPHSKQQKVNYPTISKWPDGLADVS
jgi:hypothetical protein